MPNQQNKLSMSCIKNCTQPENKSLIIHSMITACDAGTLSEEDCQGEIRIFEKNLLNNDTNFILILVQFDKNNTLAAIYEQYGDFCTISSVLGRYYEIVEVNFILEPISKNTLILFREQVDMATGIYETSDFLKGYLWNGNFYFQVLNTPYNIKAYWNNAWIDCSSQNKQWEKAQQNCNLTWNNVDKIILYIYRAQEYSISNVEDSINLPEDNTFQIVESRFVVETLSWSEKWNCFILYEGVCKTTGQDVGVIHDLNNYVYSLVEDVSPQYVVCTESNEHMVISQQDLELM